MGAAELEPADDYDPADWPLRPEGPSQDSERRGRIALMEHMTEVWRQYRLSIIAANLAAVAVREFFKNETTAINKEMRK